MFFLCLSVSATHKETKQFFTLYNTLDDKKVYLEKEVSNHSRPLSAGCAMIASKISDSIWLLFHLRHVTDLNTLVSVTNRLVLNAIHNKILISVGEPLEFYS